MQLCRSATRREHIIMHTSLEDHGESCVTASEDL